MITGAAVLVGTGTKDVAVGLEEGKRDGPGKPVGAGVDPKEGGAADVLVAKGVAVVVVDGGAPKLNEGAVALGKAAALAAGVEPNGSDDG